MFPLPVVLLLVGQIETVESKEFPKELQTTAITATVRLVNGAANAEGSGVVVGQRGPLVYILTANHLVAKADKVEVALFSAKSYPKPDRVVRAGEVVARAKDPDLALVRIIVQAPATPHLRVCPLQLAPKEQGFAVLATGCPAGEAPAGLIDKVGPKKLARKPDGTSSFVWEATQEPARGRSGGPLIDRRGFLLGICSGKNDGKGYYSHIDEIHSFLKQNGFEWLYEAPKE